MSNRPQSVQPGPGGLVHPHLHSLSAYTPGEQPREHGWIKLNTNENPFPPSPKVEAAIAAAAGSIRLYPQPASMMVRRRLAEIHRVTPEQVLVGNGSDDILNLLMRAVAGPNRAAAAIDPSYSLYPVLAGIQNAPFLRFPLSENLNLPVDAIGACDAHIFFLTSPNAPLGVGFRNDDIARLHDASPGLLIVDEAYSSFADENAMDLVKRHHRMAVVRTFSKSHSLAGLRVGYLVGHEDLVHELDKVRDSYNVDALAQAGALAALDDPGYYDAIIGKIRRIRDYYLRLFQQWGWDTFPSVTNFIATRPARKGGEYGPETAADCFSFLKSRKILVRHFPGQASVAAYLRISIGDESDMEQLEESLEAWRAS